MKNWQLIDRVLGYIEAHPEEHDQGGWYFQAPCGTTACFAGHAVILSGYKLILDRRHRGGVTAHYAETEHGPEDIPILAETLLGLEMWEAEQLFHPDLDLFEIKALLRDWRREDKEREAAAALALSEQLEVV